MSTKQFPITYEPRKVLYLASFRYGNASLTLVEVERETEKMYMLMPGATRTLVGSYIVSTFTQRLRKKRVHAFTTMLGALAYLQEAAMKMIAEYKRTYDGAVEALDQIETCIATETAQDGILMQMIDQIEGPSWQRVPFSVLVTKEDQE